LLDRVRAGDQRAATELVRRYEPALRRLVRLRLRNRRLRRIIDSSDICQAVLLRFFVRVATGPHDIHTPEQVLKLLATLARTQVVNAALHQQAAKRDCRRIAEGRAEDRDTPAPGSSPSDHAAAAELLEKAGHLFAPDEWQLLQLRKEGRGWAEIARQLGGTAEGLRKRLARAVARVTRALGLAEVGHARSHPDEDGDQD
jgi:RNA polymerase sigma factor (sigma-70 family)